MNKEFLPYEQSLSLKELGFNKPCLWFYDNNGDDGFVEFLSNENGIVNNNINDIVTSPLFQQAFKWFEDNHGFFVERKIETNVNEIIDIEYQIKSWKFKPITITFENPYDSFDKDKAELQCIKKLIEIVKDGNK